MNNFSNIKKRLSMSTTMPLGTAGSNSPEWLMGSSAPNQHEHKHDGSCCGHEHNHSHSHVEEHDDDCNADHTNPTGGCGC